MNERVFSPQQFVIRTGGTNLRLGPLEESSVLRQSPHSWAVPALIVGCSRSGTTWLYRMLKRLPGVVGLSEARLGLAARSMQRSVSGQLALFGTPRVVLDKTPSNVYELQFLAAVYGARALHLVRDPRAVVASMRDAAAHWATSTEGFSLEKAARLWVRAVDEAERAKRWWGGRLITMRYEDLLEDPPTQLKVGSQALGLRASRYAIHRAVTTETFVARARQIGSGPGRFLRFGQSDRWRCDLTPTEVSTIDEIVGERLYRFGYLPSA